jgi:hypothetical protein
LVGVEQAFDDFQEIVNADKALVDLARERRDIFKRAFKGETDVAEVFGSGSLARSTQLDPMNDVDLVIVYRAEDHDGWGEPGASAADALEYTRGRVKYLLGTDGTVDNLVRHTRWRNHAVKCWIDPPEAPDAFTVDAMPALRQDDGTLLIPQAATGEWITADPEHLIGEVAAHQRDWSYFRPMVRVLKRWRTTAVSTKVKSLVMEVLALQCMPRGGSRPEALRAFFTAAAIEVNLGVEDPAGHCGPIQRDLDIPALRTALEYASDAATRACELAADGDADEAQRVWQEVFGPDFPAPPKKDSPAVTGPALITGRPIRDAPQG